MNLTSTILLAIVAFSILWLAATGKIGRLLDAFDALKGNTIGTTAGNAGVPDTATGNNTTNPTTAATGNTTNPLVNTILNNIPFLVNSPTIQTPSLPTTAGGTITG